MADKSGIEWTDATFNPVVGCSLVNPGCTNCYAMKQAARIERMNGEKSPHYVALTKPSKSGAVWTGEVRMARDETLFQPLRWKKPRRIFVNSMGDLFHESVPDEWIDRVFAVMALAPQHTFQVLTKRARRMREYITSRAKLDENGQPADDVRAVMTALVSTPSRREMAPALKAIPLGTFCHSGPWPLPNVWLGVSAEDQARADERIPDLLATPAAVRFVSAEPLLGPIDLERAGALTDPNEQFPLLDWVIVGGESGPDARPMHADWARAIRDQCEAAGIAFFFKQNGEWIDADQWLAKLKREGALSVSGIDLTNLQRATFDQAATLAKNAGWEFAHQSDGLTLIRVGKRRAGRLLDGVEHSEFPKC
jgi:protein gp37